MLTLPTALLGHYQHFHCQQSQSTNLDALASSRDPNLGNAWFTTDEQTKGRARRGRSWVSKPGNLYSSLLLRDPAPQENLSNLPFVVSLALHDSVCDLLANHRDKITIKWPNDLLIERKKISGILIESEKYISGSWDIVIGIGVNCAHHPIDGNWQAAHLSEYSRSSITPAHIFAALATRLHERITQWDRGANFSFIRQDWLKRASGIGREIIVRMPNQEISGTFTALNEEGHLLLKKETGDIVEISAADIFFPEMHSA